MKRIGQWKSMAVILASVYLLSLLPLLLIAGYDYPSADDYSNGYANLQVWGATGSGIEVLKSTVGRTISEYGGWRGCFTSSFLSALPPCIWGERFSLLTPWIMLLMLSVATIYFFYIILVKIFESDKYVSFSISLLLLFLSVHCMPSAARAEFLYWYSGAVNYAFIHALMLFFFGLVVSVAADGEKKRIGKIIAACLIAFLASGGNQMSALNGAIVVLSAAAFITWKKQWKNCKYAGIPMGVYLVGFLFSMAAPGDWVRMSETRQMNPVKAILVSFYYTFDLAVDEWTTWPVLLGIAVMIPLFWYAAGRTKFAFRYPLLAAGYGYCLVSAMMTPPLFAVGNLEAGRLQGVTYWMYLLTLTLTVGYVTGWVRKKWKPEYKEESGFTQNSSLFLASCALFWLFGSLLTVIPEPYYYTFSSAVTDLRNGEAAGYAREMEQRLEMYRSSEGLEVVVEELEHQPELLFFSDVKDEKGEWENRALARYYGLESVVLKKRISRDQ